MKMWTFLTKIFRKTTKTCNSCGCGIDIKNDPALCLHGEENGIPFETYVCEPCCEKICAEYDPDFEDINIVEED
jgi:hypothetical protein